MFNSQQGMPYTAEQEKEFEKYMVKNKTDVLTDEYQRDYYTRMGENWVEITHPKLYKYSNYLKSCNSEDNLETWNNFLNLK